MPARSRDLAQAVGIRARLRADDDDHVALRDELLDRVLAVLGRVADVFLARCRERREALAQRRHHLRRVVDRERRLRHDREARRIAHLELRRIRHRLDEVDVAAMARIEAPHRALDLRVAGMADQDHVEAFARVLAHFHVDLGDERTGRVEHGEPAPRRFVLDRARHAMGAEDHGGAVRHRVELVHEHGAEIAQAIDDELVVDDLVPHVDRRTEKLDRPLHDVDRAIDARAESPRIREQDLHGAAARLCRLCRSASMMSMMAPVVIAMSATLNAGKNASLRWKCRKSTTWPVLNRS